MNYLKPRLKGEAPHRLTSPTTLSFLRWNEVDDQNSILDCYPPLRELRDKECFGILPILLSLPPVSQPLLLSSPLVRLSVHLLSFLRRLRRYRDHACVASISWLGE